MLTASKVTLIASLAIAIGSLAPAPALGQLEVTDEASGEHCSEVDEQVHTVEGGCPLHATSTGHPVAIEMFGSALVACYSEFEVRIDEQGDGAIYDQVLTGPTCFAEPCTEEAEREPWVFHLDSTGPGTEHLVIQFCMEHISEPMTIQCTIEASVATPGHEAIVASANAAECAENPFVHVTGSWTTEIDANHPAVEVDGGR